MASRHDGSHIRDVLMRTERAQAHAADPASSAWVAANAGTGKTHVLVTRVLRLLLAGTRPEKILCLTFTKAAAAEMSKRVFARLAEWVTLADDDLARVLEKVIGREASSEEKARARTLFAAAVETPGGFKVQTIHAFCERLLQRFPLEAGVTPGFNILEENLARSLRREAIDEVLAEATRNTASPLGKALRTAIAYATGDRFDDIVSEALDARDWLALEKGDETRRGYCEALAVPSSATSDSLARDLTEVMTEASLIALRNITAAGSAAEVAMSRDLAQAASAGASAQRVDALRRVFLKVDGTPRARLLTNGTAAEHPGEEARLRSAQSRFFDLYQQRIGLRVVEATIALLTIARAAQAAYTAGKARRAALDYDDLIERTKELLDSGGAAEWVLYKLDSGLEHILVDESQDTSPAQWQIVEALAREFFSGSGTHEGVRTLFAVGDEKQSIYSFQGAAPEKFGAKGGEFKALAESSGLGWSDITLDMSWRSTEPVLSAVDRLFAGATVPGVTGVRHTVKRLGQAGVVELWPVEHHEPAAPADIWSADEEDAAAAPPAVRLAERIADTIKGWLARKETLLSEGRPITPGDILILVRKRQPFAAPMVAALKARDIAVAGADRITLLEQIAVQDLMALGDFLTLPEDDLALAAVLKSPIFGLDDDDLLVLAPGRKGTLWKALLDGAELKPRYAEAAETLKRWRRAADYAPPFEFFASLLDGGGVRAKLLSRLGPDAADAIDEFLNLALTHDDGAPPSLTGFLHWLREGSREIKRDMEHGREEVRVMTVHGAKGLEAPIVFLPDTCGAASAGRPRAGTMALAGPSPFPGVEAPLVWTIKDAGQLPAIQAAKAALSESEREEHNRLLYVAMTRARDRLYVAGFAGKNGPMRGSWYELIEQGLLSALEDALGDDGRPVLRRACSQSAKTEPPSRAVGARQAAAPLPDWAKRPAPREAQLSIPLAPSRLAPYEQDDAGEPRPKEPKRDPLAEPAPRAPSGPGGDAKFLRGTITHALLEHLPRLAPERRPAVAKALVEAKGCVLTPGQRASIVEETLAVLSNPTFAPIFAAESRAEVPIAALLPRPIGSGPPLKLTGQIDRLAELDGEVMIVDFKTNRVAPRRAADVAEVYLLQLAAYRLAVSEIYPGKRVRAALLWTDGPKIMEIPADVLDAHAARLWDLDIGRLDG